MKYILDIKLLNQCNAASKARDDVDKILNDYRKIVICDLSRKSVFKFYSLLKGFLTLLKVKRDDTVLFQLFSNKHVLRLVSIAHKLKKFNLITLIHDIETLRKSNMDIIKKNSELLCLDKSNFIISHNKSMTNWLYQHINNENIFELELFDYLADGVNRRECLRDVCYAGNLEKSKFIYDFNPKNITISYFGNGLSGNLFSNCYYCGTFPPEILLSKLDGKFGLVWDGDSTESCLGNFGHYTLYNNPHKLSMYIAAEIPVICWSNSAISNFVVKNKIGIAINSLNELDTILGFLTHEEYDVFLKSVSVISKQVRSGYFLKRVMKKIED